MRFVVAAVLLALSTGAVQAADVTVTQEGKSFRARGAHYEALVEADGCLTSLKVDGAEFFRSAGANPRGVYFFLKKALALPEVAQEGANAVTAKSDQASIRYEFADGGMTWTVANATAEKVLLLIVFDPAVAAVMSQRGEFEKTPVAINWKTSTWFRGKANVRIAGGSRLWGPWVEKYQVWELPLAPKETRKVTVDINPATEAQIAQADAVTTLAPPPPPTDPVGPMWDMKRLSQTPKVFPAEGFEKEGVKALFFEGPPYRGKPTRVFAWVGLPKMEPGKKVPGMVLVHGGGGTAFDTWVRLWTDRGYAAIAMDTCGCVPVGTYSNWEAHEHGGPAGWGGYNQIDKPREDQWTYHAVADAVLAHSLLRSLPEVDPERIGLTGISWGGYLTSIIAGVDHRFKFAVPVYGCGYTLDMGFAASVTNLGKERGDRWMRWWDPSVYLKDAPMPMAWVTGSNDFAYWFPALQKSYRLPVGPRTLCIRLRMPHGHGAAGEAPKEIHVFADSILKGGDPLPRITGQGRNGTQAWATFESAHPLKKAELNVTKDTDPKWPERKWEALPAQVEAGRVTAILPEGVTVYYLNLFDDRDVVVSTEHEEMPPK